MKKVVILTNLQFWLKYSGEKSRIIAIINYLKLHTHLCVLFSGKIDDREHIIINEVCAGLEIVGLGGDPLMGKLGYYNLVKKFFTQNYFDFCIFEFVFLSDFIPLVPKTTKLLLDTHDIISDCIGRFGEYGQIPPNYPMLLNQEQEFALYRRYDRVILIQTQDYEKVGLVIGKEKTLLAPHPVLLNRQIIRKNVKCIGFVASGYYPNIDAINWFVRDVWPHIKDDNDVELKIFGNIADHLDFSNDERIVIKGFVPNSDMIYNEADILINPVRFGAGLKIKNVEALGNGIPLVTTSHGAIGLMEGADKAFLVADSAEQFVDKIKTLIADFCFRDKIAKESYDFASKVLSPEQCFRSLLDYINN